MIPRAYERYNLVIPRARRYYYVQVRAPNGFLFTTGLCNDEEPGWECDYATVIETAESEGGGRRRDMMIRRNLQEGAALSSSTSEAIRGISFGRSKCVYVNSDGDVETTSPSFGVMRVGDSRETGANISLVLEFDENGASTTAGGRHKARKLMADVLRRATVLDSYDEGGTVTTRYLLGDRDKTAIGTVTAEVLATTLDGRLAEKGVELDSVNPKEVILSKTDGGGAAQQAAAGGSQLAVNMEIRGHYSPPPDLDFVSTYSLCIGIGFQVKPSG